MGKDLERFTSTLPDYLHCSICLDAAYPPYTTCSEQHLACATCAAELSVQEERPLLCPTCRRSASGHLRSAPGMKRALESYGYECEHLQCTWVGTVDEEPKHAAVCEHRLVSCAACKQKYRFNTTKEHQAVCPLAKVQCPRGGQNCGGYLNGGVTTRQQAPMHARLCSNHKRVMLRCRVSENCPTRTTRANLPAHEHACRALCLRNAQLQKALALVHQQLMLAKAGPPTTLASSSNTTTSRQPNQTVPLAGAVNPARLPGLESSSTLQPSAASKPLPIPNSMFFSDDSDPDECDFDDSESEVDFLGEPMPKKIKLADPEPASA